MRAIEGPGTEANMQQTHYISGRNMYAGYPDGFGKALFGLGCFWGAERLFWKLPGVYVTSVGYGGGHTENPTYEGVCHTDTGHVELVQVIYDPARISYEELLKTFFENHDPTQGNRQGNDIGNQYRSAIYTFTEAQMRAAQDAKICYDAAYQKAGNNPITTEIAPSPAYTPAEDYHQQYLAKNPAGYCSIRGTGVSCPLPVRTPA